MTVQKTTSYSMFKFVRGNRSVNRTSLKNLMVSISKKDLLEENPIIVNQKFEVLDGQHRLEACKQLGKPVHYIVHKDGGIQDVQLLNSAVRAWRFEDYIKSYSMAGNKNYKVLGEFSQSHGIAIGVAVMLLSGVHRGKNGLLQDFRDGKFEVLDREGADVVINELDVYRKYIEPEARKDRDFISAVIFMHDNKPVSFLSMLEKLQQYCADEPMKRQASMREYLRMFEGVYNKHKQTNITRFF